MSPGLFTRSVTAMSGRAHGTRYFLAEWYRGELDQDEIDRIAAVLDESSRSVSAGGASVRRVMTMAVPAGEWMFGIFEADSADTVEQVCRHAGMAPQQLNPAVEDRVRGTYRRDDSALSGND
jgi:muconolactone delta-isomerase